jgi:hypothetical protein
MTHIAAGAAAQREISANKNEHLLKDSTSHFENTL